MQLINNGKPVQKKTSMWLWGNPRGAFASLHCHFLSSLTFNLEESFQMFTLLLAQKQLLSIFSTCPLSDQSSSFPSDFMLMKLEFLHVVVYYFFSFATVVAADNMHLQPKFIRWVWKPQFLLYYPYESIKEHLWKQTNQQHNWNMYYLGLSASPSSLWVMAQ